MATTQVRHSVSTEEPEQPANYEDVRHQIEGWPPVERARLAQYIITTLIPDEEPRRKRRNSVAEIFGQMAIEGVPAPTDAEVARMIEDYRTEKYG